MSNISDVLKYLYEQEKDDLAEAVIAEISKQRPVLPYTVPYTIPQWSPPTYTFTC